MKERRTNRLQDQYRDLAAEFLERESSRIALVTVTSVSMTSDGDLFTCYLSVFPTEKEGQAIDFARRKERDLRNYVASNTKTKHVPEFHFEIDKGEKNRQRIDELLRKG